MNATTKTVSKAVNYTAEQTASILEQYASGVSVDSIAQSVGKSVRSIVAKLSREGVYKKKEYVTKTGEAVVKKDQLADKLAELVGFTEAETESLTKVNKTALQKLVSMAEAFKAEA